MNKTFYIDGIASSQALDTSGEVVDLKGLDISSLIDAAISWEHKKESPAQLVGKILEAKKIFGKEDCENPRHLYYWNKCQLPFLYIKARLFHDKPSSQEVIALFKDDAQHPDEGDMLGFSVEGSKISKTGAVIDRSIARLVTLANHPANKSCIAEMAPDKNAKIDPNDVSELFKGEVHLFSFEPSYIQILDKKEELKKDGATGAGAFIGSQLAMSEKLKKDATVAPDSAKPVSAGATPPTPPPPPMTAQGISAGFMGAMGMGEIHKAEYDELEKSGWSKPSISGNAMSQNHPSHGNLTVSKNPIGKFDIHHNKKLIGTTNDASKAGGFARKYATGLGKMEKSLSAGSMNAAPGQLAGGAALGKEDLDRKMKKTSLQKKEKSQWYGRASESYKTWDKREKFREYMKKRMPHLAEGEVDAIGKVLALKKNLQAEKNLSKMYASHFIKKDKV